MHTAQNGDMTTGLQVVRNEIDIPFLGVFYVWWLPYISCVVVTIGMLMHFGVRLYGFLVSQVQALSAVGKPRGDAKVEALS
jgi:hypothetical protein